MPQCRTFAAKHILQSPTRDIPLVQSLKKLSSAPSANLFHTNRKGLAEGVKRKSREIWRDYFSHQWTSVKNFRHPGINRDWNFGRLERLAGDGQLVEEMSPFSMPSGYANPPLLLGSPGKGA
ncbi:hypothetical protein CDAR_400161 [Caerostris darwini]|uniref:Uncharacterized protein n=1 Tax=Caerostris darwini TaxID=1538125 RepID=A0AAV4SDJ3_9ARAC|nr:hypothetical protein CDAR_400161 [Caerostris darwini]